MMSSFVFIRSARVIQNIRYLIRPIRKIAMNIPLVVILGATGTGKSKLALEIASRYGSEIISADSMQVYKGLDIITNKVTAEERAAVKHHLIDFVSPFDSYSVVDFRDAALPIHVLHDGSLSNNHKGAEHVATVERNSASRGDLHRISTPLLYERLKEVDADMAGILHPKNRRKIIRSLEVFEEFGRRHSEILADQRATTGGSHLGGPLRFPLTCILWLDCEQNVLHSRLDARVDEMLKSGLITELLGFHEIYNKQRIQENESRDYMHGIFQSLGFKEFHEYLIMSEEQRATDEALKLFQQGIEYMKIATRRYSRKQIKWIKNRLLRGERQTPPIYRLDATLVEQWERDVQIPAFEIVDAFCKKLMPSVKPLPIIEKDCHDNKVKYCDVCDKYMGGSMQWNEHINSRPHRKLVRKANKQPVEPVNV